MQRVRYYYLIKVQYLGYRLHGWQKQPNFKTVEGLITKTLRYVMPEARYKVLGCSRTDAMVSSNGSAFELFVDEQPLENLEDFLALFNLNLPQDIRVTEISISFSIPKLKNTPIYFLLEVKTIRFVRRLWQIFSSIWILIR